MVNLARTSQFKLVVIKRKQSRDSKTINVAKFILETS